MHGGLGFSPRGSRLAGAIAVLTGILAAAICAGAASGSAAVTPSSQTGKTLTPTVTWDTAHDVSPPLRWSHIPPHTRTFALRLDDPDAPGGTFTHWTAWNFDAGALALVAGAGERWRFEGTNSFGRVGYAGPCPPRGSTHRYVFRLYAFDARLPLRRGASTGQFAAALRGHVVATARLVGLYRRP